MLTGQTYSDNLSLVLSQVDSVTLTLTKTNHHLAILRGGSISVDLRLACAWRSHLITLI